MKALLLAAGLGTRLRPITNHIPKCLVPIKQKPLLAYWLDLLLSDGIDELLINTHYLPNAVNDFINESHWRDRITLVHENELLGTGGTLLKNRDFFKDEPFFIGHADNLTRFDLNAFINAHANRPESVEITMMTFDTDVPHQSGVVDLDHLNRVIGFYEKVPEYHGTKANAAVYIMEPTIIDFLDSLGRSVIDLSTEVLPNYLGRMLAFHNSNYHRDIGTNESLRLAEAEF
jgi:mannose-1-phosphate guanylyltransferase